MSSDINDLTLGVDPRDPAEWWIAAINVAGGLAFHHPHPSDGSDSKAAGQKLAQNPAIAADLRELLDAIGYEHPEPPLGARLVNALCRYHIRRATARIADLEAEIDGRLELNALPLKEAS